MLQLTKIWEEFENNLTHQSSASEYQVSGQERHNFNKLALAMRVIEGTLSASPESVASSIYIHKIYISCIEVVS